MHTISRLLLPVAVAAIAMPAVAQTVEPRVVATSVAETIAARYYDAAKGEKIAAELSEAIAAGTFDKETDARDLATALSNWLRPKDSHFNVTWRPPGAEEGPGGGPGPVVVRRPGGPGGPGAGGPQPRRVESPFLRRDNYGFRKVEILPGNIGYIDIRQFAPFDFGDAKAPARAAADAALGFVLQTDAVIIDLRENGGGSPAMVGYLVSAFTAPNADIYNTFTSREGTDRENPRVPYAKPRLDVPVYVLISARTGSAAEAFAYTLQQAGRATIVGDDSGGAANPGGFFPVGGGFAVFVSTGSPTNPISKKNWEGTGVIPNVKVPPAEALTEARRLALTATIGKAAGPLKTDGEWALAGLEAEQKKGGPAPAGLVGDYSGLTVAVNGAGDLELRRGRRPPTPLVQLGPDLYAVRYEPGRRVQFERDASGKVVAVSFLTPEGPGPRFKRD